MITLLLTFRDPTGVVHRELRMLAYGYAEWAAALARSVQSTLASFGGPLYASALLAEEYTRSRSRIRQHKGFAAFYLDPHRDPAGAWKGSYELVQSAHQVDQQSEFLYAVLSAPLATAGEVFRLALNWASSSVVVAPHALGLADADDALRAALRIEPRGRSTAVTWDRIALHQCAQDSIATVGLTGVGISSTLPYSFVLEEPLLSTLPDRLMIDVEAPDPLPEWWSPPD